MVYQIEDYKLFKLCSMIYGILFIVVFIELCVVICSIITSVFWILRIGSISDVTLGFLNTSILMLIWTLIPCIVFGVIERNLETSDYIKQMRAEIPDDPW